MFFQCFFQCFMKCVGLFFLLLRIFLLFLCSVLSVWLLVVWFSILVRLFMVLEIDMLLLLRIISRFGFGFMLLVCISVLNVMLVVIVLLLIIVMILWLLFLDWWVMVMLSVVEIEVEEWLMLKVLYLFFLCFGNGVILFFCLMVWILLWWLVRILCGQV